jgi:mono/diheme cytochrome c family protein
MSLTRTILWASLFAAAAFALSEASAAPPSGKPSVEHGRYISKIAGCNDCHTSGYLLRGGQVPEKDWLLGDSFGWRGDWGTTYAVNLRMYMKDMTEDQWVKQARTLKARPPMPWFSLNEMDERDLRSLYRFVKTLAPAGNPAPAYVPPGQTPSGPFAQFPAAPK